MRTLLLAAFLHVSLLLGACASPEPWDYTLYEAHYPRSVLVLPPLDNTM